MNITFQRIGLVLAIVAGSASAQSVLFDFNDAPLHSSLPVDLTVGGITAHFTGTGSGFSIQDTSAPVVPVGFTGRFIYPNSVFPADLLIDFDRMLTDFSILYSPQELACDDSATMRVTASLNGTFVGTQTKTASNPGTWPVDTLSCSFPQGFNSVVVHYDTRPPTCQDWGPIFLADDMRVTPLTNPVLAFCFGDGSEMPCPCSNTGSAGHGCNNRQTGGTGGSLLAATGLASLGADTLLLDVTNTLDHIHVLFEGSGSFPTRRYGAGLRCVGTAINGSGQSFLKRIEKGTAVGGSISFTGISATSSAKGAPLHAGETYYYYAAYRNAEMDGAPGCPGIEFGFNASNAISAVWGP